MPVELRRQNLGAGIGSDEPVRDEETKSAALSL